MKKLVAILVAIVINVTLWAQSPDKMSYQAVIRNSSNQLITNTQVGMKISILKGLPPTYTAVYWEIQTPTTNANGLVSIEIGGTYSGFDTIHWSNGPYFIKTETDPNGGTNYTITGESELLSVPYALHSKTAESVTGAINETDPVYGVSPAAGITGTNISNWNNNMLPAGTDQQTLYHDGVSWWTANNLKNDGAVVRITNLEVFNSLNVQTALNLNAVPGTSPMYVLSNYKVNNLNSDLLDGKHATDFLTSFTETDPTFSASPSFGITTSNINNWNNNMLPAGLTGQTIYHNGTSWLSASNMTNDGNYISINSLKTYFPIEANQGMMSSGPIFINYSPSMPPMYVSSAIKVDNLNVDLLDDKHAADFSLTTHNHGTGTVNYIPKWNSSSTFGNSVIYDNGVSIGIGTTLPSQKLDVNGNINVAGNVLAGGINTSGQITSTIATGTAPFVITSTIKATNLNADMADGYHAGNASDNIPVSNGTINTNLNSDMVDGYHANGLVKIVTSGTVTAGNYVDITIPNYYPFTLQLSTGWPGSYNTGCGGQAMVQGFVNDNNAGFMISYSNGAEWSGAPGTAAVTSVFKSARMLNSVTIFSFGGSGGNLYTLSTMGSNLVLRITAAIGAIEVYYKLTY